MRPGAICPLLPHLGRPNYYGRKWTLYELSAQGETQKNRPQRMSVIYRLLIKTVMEYNTKFILTIFIFCRENIALRSQLEQMRRFIQEREQKYVEIGSLNESLALEVRDQ